jgi:hypothetical protein
MGMLHFFSWFRHPLKSRFAFVPSYIMRHTLRYPPLPARFLAALIWDEIVVHGCWPRSFIGRIVLLLSLGPVFFIRAH